MSACFCTNLRLATRRLTAVYDAALKELDINIGQYFMLRIISNRVSISLTELGEHAELERSTVGRNVRVLERMGLVGAARGEVDQREAIVSLTPKGAALLQQAEPLWKSAQKATESRLGTGNLQALRRALEAI